MSAVGEIKRRLTIATESAAACRGYADDARLEHRAYVAACVAAEAMAPGSSTLPFTNDGVITVRVDAYVWCHTLQDAREAAAKALALRVSEVAAAESLERGLVAAVGAAGAVLEVNS